MRSVFSLVLILTCLAPAEADQFLVGERGTNGDYPFRGC